MMRNTSKLFLWTSLFLALAVLSAPPAKAAESSPFGVNIHAPGGDELKLVLDRAQAAGIGWVRIDLVWAFVEPARDAYDWRLYDEIAAAAQARGIEIYATLAYTPGWATSGPEWIGVPETAEWAEFCALAAKRYRGKIRHWGLWNEPNLDKFWGGSRQQYIDVILKPGADAIHAAVPEAQVGGPDLAHLTADDSDWYRWLREVIVEAGGKLDFITHHVYDLDGARDVARKLDDDTPFGGTPSLWDAANPSLEEVLKNAGWWGRPVWLTEVGWESHRVGEDRQSTHYQGVLNDWLTGQGDRSWLQKIFFYEMKDGGSDPSWGILRADGSAKPAYNAYREFIGGRQPEPEDEDKAAVVSSTFPTTMEAGQQLPVELTFRNTGTTTWTKAAGYQLGADGDSDPFTAARQPLANGDRIAPDQQKTFSFTLTAPSTPGTYTVRWRMLREGVDRFGATFTRQIQVTAAPPAGQRALRLLDNGFRVEVSWRDPGSGRAGYGRAIPNSAQTGYFWFFDQSNFELVVKVLDGRPLNGSYWVFYGALSDVEYWITVTETRTGRVKRYHNAPGNLCGRGDTSAFPTGRTAAEPEPLFSPEPQVFQAMELPVLPEELPELSSITAAAGSCVANANSLCLFDDRFRVAVDWRTPDGATGKGTAIPASSESGTFWFFYGALSDVQYTITVTDTATGAVKRYRNAQGNLCGQGDTAAF